MPSFLAKPVVLDSCAAGKELVSIRFFTILPGLKALAMRIHEWSQHLPGTEVGSACMPAERITVARPWD